MADVLLMGDPAVAAVPVAECGSPLVDLHTTALALDDRKRDAAGSFALLRAEVVDRLAEAQRRLPDGLALLVVEGHRPPELQRRYFDEYRDQLRRSRPELSPDALDLATSRYISPPAVAPHCAGAAVDLTLRTADGVELDLGTPVNATPEESDGGCYTDSPRVLGAARENRQVLATALRSVGLVNYPTEWWHWSYGDRYWALSTGAPAALCGPVDPPDS